MFQRKNTLKIAYLLDSFPALSETFIVNEIIELKRQGLDIAVFSLNKSNDDFMHKEAGELVRETCYLSNFRNLSKAKKAYNYLYSHLYFFISNPFRYLRAFWFAYKIYGNFFGPFKGAASFALMFRKLGVKHLHAHFAAGASELAILVFKLSGIPYSFTMHAYDIFIEPRLIKEKVGSARFVVVISEYNKKFIEKKYTMIEKNKIRVIHCGINLERFSFFSSKENRKCPFVILSVGRLVEKKGHKYLLEAITILLDRGICDFICKIVGDGPLREDLENLARALGLYNVVQFVGVTTSDKIFSLLEEADLFVLPCVVAENGDMDGIPVSLIEAMALGKPVISTCVSGIPELIKDGSGILVPHGDSKSLADAIEEIYFMDLDGRERMGQKGREIVEMEFNIEKESKKINNLFYLN